MKVQAGSPESENQRKAFRSISRSCFFLYTQVLGGDKPRRVDPDDADVAEENTLFVLLVFTGAALLSPLAHVGQLWSVVPRCGTHDGDAGGWRQRRRNIYLKQ